MEMVKHIMLLKGRFDEMRKLGEVLKVRSSYECQDCEYEWKIKKIPLKRGDMAKGYS